MRTESFNATLLSILVITSLTAFLLLAATAKSLGASPAEDAENFSPVADAEVTHGNPDSPDGDIYNLYVGWNSTYLSERAYFRFDFENIPSGSTINSAVLWVNSKYGPSRDPGYIDTWNLVDVHSVSDDTWDESTLTWNTAPPIGAAILDTENFQADGYVGQYKWYSWDVTSYVTSEFDGGDSLVSICLKRADPENESESAGWFYGKDTHAGQPAPYLEVSWSGVGVVEELVGAKAGDWVKYDYTYTVEPTVPLPTWIKVEFLSVEETTVTARVTTHLSDGTESSENVTMDVEAGGGGTLSGFIIPANSKVGDSINMTGLGPVTIEGKSTRTYAGASRTVVHASVSGITFYWDKQTGVLVEASMVGATAKATETNLWQAGVSALLYVLVAVIAASAGGAAAALWVRSKRRRLKRARRVPKRRKKGKRRAT